MLKQIIEMVQNAYQPGFRFIESIEPDFPASKGTFRLPQRQYTMHDEHGLYGASSIILMTQAMIISFADNLYQKKIPQLQDLELKNIREIEEFCKNSVVCNYKNVKFKKIIWREDPDHAFELKFTKITCKKDVIFTAVDYNISSGKNTGSWIVAYNKNKFVK